LAAFAPQAAERRQVSPQRPGAGHLTVDMLAIADRLGLVADVNRG
jgi:hypothetical protein